MLLLSAVLVVWLFGCLAVWLFGCLICEALYGTTRVALASVCCFQCGAFPNMYFMQFLGNSLSILVLLSPFASFAWYHTLLCMHSNHPSRAHPPISVRINPFPRTLLLLLWLLFLPLSLLCSSRRRSSTGGLPLPPLSSLTPRTATPGHVTQPATSSLTPQAVNQKLQAVASGSAQEPNRCVCGEVSFVSLFARPTHRT